MLYDFLTSNEMDQNNRKTAIKHLKDKYPFIKHGILSKSLCGRDIDYLQVGKINEPVLYVGAVHGMEWITSALLLLFFDYICSKTELFGINTRSFFAHTGLIVIPCLNPDGVEIQIHGPQAAGAYKPSSVDAKIWQANAGGVDLNHNFDSGWQELHQKEIAAGITSPGPTRYGGSHPFSEPESIAISEFCKTIKFRHAMAFHSQGKEIYWDYGKCTPQRAELMAIILGLYSGYKVSRPEGLAVGGGFKDWFIETFRKPAFTIEVGEGKNPLPISDLPCIYEDLLQMMIMGIIFA